MQVGIHFADFTLPGGAASIAPVVHETVRIADEGGVDSFTFMDHWFQMEQFQTAHDPMLEGYTALGFVAGLSERMRLGLLVTGVTYRHPGLLAKTVTTLDVLSGGRAELGIGAAWYEREHLALGVPYPAVSERFERLEETLQICLQMWSDDDGPYSGTHYQLAETICSPMPLQQPHPPIRIGGAGERKTLRLVARYADACNLFATGPDEVGHKLEVLERHCVDEDRDPATIRKTMLAFGNPTDDLDGFLSQMEAYAALGITQVDLMPGKEPVAYTTGVCEQVVPRLASIS